MEATRFLQIPTLKFESVQSAVVVLFTIDNKGCILFDPLNQRHKEI